MTVNPLCNTIRRELLGAGLPEPTLKMIQAEFEQHFTEAFTQEFGMPASQSATQDQAAYETINPFALAQQKNAPYLSAAMRKIIERHVDILRLGITAPMHIGKSVYYCPWDWCATATQRLCQNAKARIRNEITTHYLDAYESALAQEMTEPEAHHAAMASLGNPKQARKQFERTYLTCTEEMVITRLGESLHTRLVPFIVKASYPRKFDQKQLKSVMVDRNHVLMLGLLFFCASFFLEINHMALGIPFVLFLDIMAIPLLIKKKHPELSVAIAMLTNFYIDYLGASFFFEQPGLFIDSIVEIQLLVIFNILSISYLIRSIWVVIKYWAILKKLQNNQQNNPQRIATI